MSKPIEKVLDHSVLDNKETFLHFLRSNQNRKFTTSSKFNQVQYRKFNLSLANSLEQTSWAGEETLQRTISALRSCSSVALLKITSEGAEVARTSNKCRNKYCAICARAKSAMISERLLNYLEGKSQVINTKKQGAYFLTLTLKADSKTRSGIYVDELKDYIYKLMRSTVWKKNFITDEEKIIHGVFRNIESTFSKDKAHIHTHALIMTRKIQKPIKEVEREIRNKWFKLTKDSHQARIDLIRKNRTRKKNTSKPVQFDHLFSAIKEVVKYSVKISARKNDLGAICEKIAEFIVRTKGINFLTTTGDLRGEKLTSWKSDWDKEYEKQEFDPEAKYALARTSKLRFDNEVEYYKGSKQDRAKIPGQKLIKVNDKILKIDSSDYVTSEIMRWSINEQFLPEHLEFLGKVNDIKIGAEKQEEEPGQSDNELYDVVTGKILSQEESELIHAREQMTEIPF